MKEEEEDRSYIRPVSKLLFIVSGHYSDRTVFQQLFKPHNFSCNYCSNTFGSCNDRIEKLGQL